MSTWHLCKTPKQIGRFVTVSTATRLGIYHSTTI